MSQPIIFYVFSAILLFSGLMVVISRQAVRGVLFLVLAFVAASVLWMLLQAEFLSLVLIFVYIGAVMTLFLFVVMMLNLQETRDRTAFVRYLPFAILAMLLLVGLMIWLLLPRHFALAHTAVLLQQPSTYSSVAALGDVLYTHYLLPFEIAAVILLVAILAAISLAFRGRQNSRTQNIAKQVMTDPKTRVALMDVDES